MTNRDTDWGSYSLTADPGKPLREARATIAALTEDLEALNGIIKGLRQMLADSSSAAEIERLQKLLLAEENDSDIHRKLYEVAVSERESGKCEIERLREQLRLANIDAFNSAAEADTLRTERDEARREICQNKANDLSMELGGAAIFGWVIAKNRGWNCFKENT